MDAITKAAATAILAANDFHMMHIYSKNEDFDKSHHLTQSYYTSLSYEADELLELAIRENQPAFNPTDALTIIPDWTPERGTAYDYTTIINSSKRILSSYITALQSVRDSASTTDIESQMDDILHRWRTELNYKLAQRTNPPSVLNGFINTGLDNVVAYTASQRQF